MDETNVAKNKIEEANAIAQEMNKKAVDEFVEPVYNIVDIENELRKVSKAMLPADISVSVSKRARGGTYNADFENFYTKSELLRQVGKKHSWTRATVSTIARATVGAGFSFVRHPIYGKNVKVTPEEMDNLLEKVYDFFYGTRMTKYIQDTITLPSKIYYTVVSLVFYGQAAWEIIRDEDGLPIGFDVLAGVMQPNVNAKGRFLRPAYYFRAWNSAEVVSYRRPTDIIYMTWPGIDMSIYGESEYDAVSEVSIPSDIYASTAYRNHFENTYAPYNGIWVVDRNTSEEDYKRFLVTLVNRYAGVVNFGRTPIVIRGDAEFKETRSRSNDDAPYLEGRRYNQEEIAAVSAVPSAMLGLASNTTKTNFREQRRDFHENTLRPIFEIIEQSIYQQIIVREFDIKQWMLSFNSPDLTTALEAATINTRYIQNGVYTPNEVRNILGYASRGDDMGDAFYQPSNSNEAVRGESDLASTPGERDTEPEGASMRQMDNVRVPTQDRAHTGREEEISRGMLENAEDIVKELRAWRNFAARVADGKRSDRPFDCQHVPDTIANVIDDALGRVGNNSEVIKAMFNDIIHSIEQENLTND